MVPAAGFKPVEQTVKCFLQFDSETGLFILLASGVDCVYYELKSSIFDKVDVLFLKEVGNKISIPKPEELLISQVNKYGDKIF